jgi:hypothetical protein
MTPRSSIVHRRTQSLLPHPPASLSVCALIKRKAQNLTDPSLSDLFLMTVQLPIVVNSPRSDCGTGHRGVGAGDNRCGEWADERDGDSVAGYRSDGKEPTMPDD